MASKGVCLKMVTGQHPKPCKTCNSVAVLYIARYEFSPNQQYHAYTAIYIWIYDSGGCICNVAITYKPNQHVSLGYMIVAVGRWMMEGSSLGILISPKVIPDTGTNHVYTSHIYIYAWCVNIQWLSPLYVYIRYIFKKNVKSNGLGYKIILYDIMKYTIIQWTVIL